MHSIFQQKQNRLNTENYLQFSLSFETFEQFHQAYLIRVTILQF